MHSSQSSSPVLGVALTSAATATASSQAQESHINVECAATSNVIAYLYMYLLKGTDSARSNLFRNPDGTEMSPEEQRRAVQLRDEIDERRSVRHAVSLRTPTE